MIDDVATALIAAAIAHGSDGKGSGGLQGFIQYLARSDPQLFRQIVEKQQKESRP